MSSKEPLEDDVSTYFFVLCIPAWWLHDLPSFGQGTNHLQEQDTTADTAAADLAALLAAHTDIVTDGVELGANTSSAGLLGGHAKVQDITGVVHGNDQDTIVGRDPIDGGSADLLCGGGSKDGTSNGGVTETLTNVAGKGGLVAGATASHDGDLVLLAGGIRPAEHDLVLGVICKGRVSEGERVESGLNQMVRVGKEVLGCVQVSGRSQTAECEWGNGFPHVTEWSRGTYSALLIKKWIGGKLYTQFQVLGLEGKLGLYRDCERKCHSVHEMRGRFFVYIAWSESHAGRPGQG